MYTFAGWVVCLHDTDCLVPLDLLGERLECEDEGRYRDNANLCYICSGNVDKFVECWFVTTPPCISPFFFSLTNFQFLLFLLLSAFSFFSLSLSLLPASFCHSLSYLYIYFFLFFPVFSLPQPQRNKTARGSQVSAVALQDLMEKVVLLKRAVERERKQLTSTTSSVVAEKFR